jgi:hypothetical protein
MSAMKKFSDSSGQGPFDARLFDACVTLHSDLRRFAREA